MPLSTAESVRTCVNEPLEFISQQWNQISAAVWPDFSAVTKFKKIFVQLFVG